MKALLVLDFVNEIIHEDGKFKGKGYAEFAKQHDTLAHVAQAITKAREKNIEIIFVRIAFDKTYSNKPKNSVLLGKADQFQALIENTWATEFHEALNVTDYKVFQKQRISPFSNPDFETYLKDKQITELYVSGVATDLVVQSAVRDAHDRDYIVYVLSDCCAAGSIEEHDAALHNLKKIAIVGTAQELLE